jgi:type II secretory ATPase GspE/PulE/Tfp pilus assembly ATPase PilB-like protein
MAPFHAPEVVDRLLSQALASRASDLHVEPVAAGYEARLRIDGLLTVIGTYSADDGRALVTRLMVLAKLLTYRPDVPQEGRSTWTATGKAGPIELRISVMPTARGPRLAVRIPSASAADLGGLTDLGLPPELVADLRTYLGASSGMLIVTGPAGSGKTTLLYALLRELVLSRGGQSVVSLEDPVERLIDGVTQIEVSPFGELTYERALRSMLRQDPQVLMLGEVRDAPTARLAAQAASSGHRMLLTLHADDAASAIRRLLDMGLEPHQITSTLYAVVTLRLLRRLDPADPAGYRGRIAVAEWVRLGQPLRDAILRADDADSLRLATRRQDNHQTLHAHALRLVQSGITDLAEVHRVLGTNHPT